jgi:hypothetical protein
MIMEQEENEEVEEIEENEEYVSKVKDEKPADILVIKDISDSYLLKRMNH